MDPWVSSSLQIWTLCIFKKEENNGGNHADWELKGTNPTTLQAINGGKRKNTINETQTLKSQNKNLKKKKKPRGTLQIFNLHPVPWKKLLPCSREAVARTYFTEREIKTLDRGIYETGGEIMDLGHGDLRGNKCRLSSNWKNKNSENWNEN